MNLPLRSNHFSVSPFGAPAVVADDAVAFLTAYPSATSAAEHAARPASTRILVVEDDADVCETIGRFLRHAGYQVDSASDGEAGWDALLHYRFNLLLTDNRMPRLTGLELIERLRAAGSSLPAILASGTLPWDEADAPLELQPIGTLEKPFSGFDLLAKVRTVLRRLVPSTNLVPETIAND